MKRLIAPLLFVSIFLGSSFYSKSVASSNPAERDSLLRVLKTANDTTQIKICKKLYKMVSANHDSALMFLHRAVDLAEKTNSPKWISEAQIDYVNWYTNFEPNIDSAVYLCRNYLNRMIAAKYYKGMGVAAGWMGRIYIWHSLDSAIYYDWKSIEYFKMAKDSFGAAITQSNLANVYAEAGNNTEAIRVGLEALEYAKRIKFKSLIYNTSINLGEYFQRTGQLKEAEKYTLESYNYIDSTPTNIAYYNWEMANIRFLSGNYTEAKKLYTFVAETGLKSNEDVIIALGYDGLAKIAEKEKNWNDVIKYKSTAWQHAEKNRENRESYNEMLYKAYDAKGNYKEALTYYKNYVAVRDSYDVAARLKQVDALEKRFKASEKQSKIDLLEKEKQLQQAETGRQKNMRNTIALVFVLAIVLGAFAFYRFKNRTKEKQEAERARISRDLHDDVGATLSSISIFSEAANQKLKNNNTNDAGNLLERISTDAQEMVNVMSDFVWTLNPANDSFQKIIDRMQSYASPVLSARDIKMYFEADETLHTLVLKPEVRRNLFLIFKEAINNSAKYSQATAVHISLKNKNKFMEMLIADNGKGFDVSIPHNGNGITNIHARAKEIDAVMQINSGANGTVIEVVCDV